MSTEKPKQTADYCWGIDLGGTKLEGVVFDPVSSQMLCRTRIPTEAHKGYQHIIGRIAALLEMMKTRTALQPTSIGVCHPGSEDSQSKQIKNSNTTCLNGRPLRADLEQALGCPLRMDNDANCFALAEATLGAARNHRTVFGVILGTGVGGGIVVNQQVLKGPQGIAGEWGHNVLIPDGDECYCGRRGCVETVISGPALEKFYQESSGTRLELSEIASRAATGEDENARRTIAHLTANFGAAVSVVINILDPDCIVLGGGVSNIDALYSGWKFEAEKHVFNNQVETPVVKNQLGDSAGVFGAAMLNAK